MSEQKEKRGSFEFIISIKLECFTTSKTDPHLLLQKVLKKISVIKANTYNDIEKNSSFWHFDSRFVLKTTETSVFMFSLLRLFD